jgi:hypothetical protein
MKEYSRMIEKLAQPAQLIIRKCCIEELLVGMDLLRGEMRLRSGATGLMKKTGSHWNYSVSKMIETWIGRGHMNRSLLEARNDL